MVIDFSSPDNIQGGPMVKNLFCHAGDKGSIPDQGTKIQHASTQVRPCATTRKSVHPNRKINKQQDNVV